MKKITYEHHRRPRSLGGSDSSANISYVPGRLHKYWHTLFGNMNAEQIANQTNLSPWKPEGVTVVCRFINGTEVSLRGENNSKRRTKRLAAWNAFFGEPTLQETIRENNSKRRTKRLAAWNALFGKPTFQETIDYINNVWLDPSYHFYVVK